MIKRGYFFRNLKHRFGFLPKIEKSNKKRIWIQAVSVGEVNAIKNFIELLSEDFEIILTTTTVTAHEVIAGKMSKNLLFYGYFPWDFFIFSKIAWARICPDAIILSESELWPEHLHQAKKKNIPIFLVNGRLSNTSFNRYLLFPKMASKFWNQLDFAIASSRENELKISKFFTGKLYNFGNMKFDMKSINFSINEKNILLEELGFGEKSFIILGNSTWPGEEILLLEVLRRLMVNDIGRKYKLLLVPRHAERRGEIIQEIKKYKFSYHQRSCGKSEKEIDICLADTTGELGRLAHVADLAFIGKSLKPNDGGQSPLDAAIAGIPIIYGDRMTNFRDICTQIEKEKAVIKVKDKEEAIVQLIKLSQDEEKRKVMSENIKKWFLRNQGASEKVYELVKSNIGS